MRRKTDDGVKLTLDRLTEVLRYEPRAGLFYWKTTSNRRMKPGSVAGFVTTQGYVSITIDGHAYNCGRLAWYYSHKEWPTNQVQHINGDKLDNRLANLRLMGLKWKAGVNISRKRICEMVKYDPDNGSFTWLIAPSPRVRVGDEAGVISTLGYRYLSLDGNKFLAHRVAWYVSFNEWPDEQIDHINGVRGDNRLCNLRAATAAQNAKNTAIPSNNTSGFKGVSFSQHYQKWIARIISDYRIYPLGRFDTKEEAHAAYLEASKRLHGEFARIT